MIDWDAEVLAKCQAVFGEAQLPRYTPPGGVPFDVGGIFDDAHKALVMSADGEPEINTVAPVIGVRLAEWPTPPAQDGQLFIPRTGKTYIVRDVQPDGHGDAFLILGLKAP